MTQLAINIPDTVFAALHKDISLLGTAGVIVLAFRMRPALINDSGAAIQR